MQIFLFLAGLVGLFITNGEIILHLLFFFVHGMKLDIIFCSCSSEQKIDSFKRLIVFSTMQKNSDPEGFIFGKEFIGYIMTKPRNYYSSAEKVIYLFASKRFLQKNHLLEESEQETKPVNEEEDNEANKVTIWDREGEYRWLRFNGTEADVNYEPLMHQKDIIDAIIAHNTANITTTVMLHGPPGSGKSMIPLLLAKHMKASVVDTFNPTDPGDSMGRLIKDANPRKSKKLVIVFEEVDIMIDNIHYNKIEVHKDIPILIKNKQEWNSFLDKFDRKFFQHIILIMTTNKSPDYFDSLDASYMREGRVNLKFAVSNNKEKMI